MRRSPFKSSSRQSLMGPGRSAQSRNVFITCASVLLVCSIVALIGRGSRPSPGGREAEDVGGGGNEALRAALLEQRRAVGVVDGPPEKFVTFLVCKGYCNQLMALADGIAMCYLLNATCVLPKLYKHYDAFAPASQVPTYLAQFDSQADHAVDMSYFFDTQHFIEKLAGMVKILPELPAWLQGDVSGAYDEIQEVDPSLPHKLLPFRQLLHRKNVLRLRCTLHLMPWNTQGMGELRRAIYSALRPSRRVQEAYEARLAALAEALGEAASPPPQPPLQYLAVHIRDEEDWRKYCGDEAQNPADSMIERFEACYLSAAEVGRQLVEWGLGRQYRHVYVANGNMTAEKARALMGAGAFDTVASEAVTCTRREGKVRCSRVEVDEGALELRAAVDLLMLQRSPFFVGNVFSSFSWWIRVGRLLSRDSMFAPSTTLYYNKDPIYTAGDLRKEESHRFGVHPGILQPAWHGEKAQSYYGLHLQQLEGRCLHAHSWEEGCGGPNAFAAFPNVEAMEVTEARFVNMGLIFFKGFVRASVGHFNWHPPLYVSVDGKHRGNIVAYANGTSDGRLSQVGFEAEIPVLPQDLDPGNKQGGKGVVLEVCTNRFPVVCAKKVSVRVGPALRRDDESGEPVLWMWLPGKPARTGGPEALHQLHAEVNRLHAAGELAVWSAFPEGDEYYASAHSNFTGEMEFHHLGPRDYVLVPEHHTVSVPRTIQYVMGEVGAQGLIWHLGQHVTQLAITVEGKETFKPICLSPYFARLLECPEKAIINVPMADVFLDMGRQEDARPTEKEDIVLYDDDDTRFFDPTSLKLPPGVELVLMKGFNRSDVVGLMRRAKVYLDSFLTGNERGLFEATLLRAVPVLSNHGPGASQDIPLPKRYKWQYHDYAQLSGIIQYALAHYDQALREVQPFRRSIYDMGAMMSEGIRRYFQDDVHVVLPMVPRRGRALTNSERHAAFAALLAAIVQYPFSTQELVSDGPGYAECDAADVVFHLHDAGLLNSFVSSQVQPEYRRFGPRAVYLQRPLARHFRNYALIVPPNRMPLHPNLAASMFKAAHGTQNIAVFGPDGVVLVDWAKYYNLVNANLWFFDDAFGTEDLQRLLTHLGRPFGIVRAVEELSEERRRATPWTKPHRCGVATLEMLSKELPSNCFCKDFGEITKHALWAGRVRKMPERDKFRVWLEEVQKHCARYAGR